MIPALLAAFVAGVFLLQQQAALPARIALAGLALAAVAFGALALRARRRRDAVGQGPAAAVLLAAACATGFAYAGWRAHDRLDVALSAAEEGRDVDVVGIVAGLPSAMERGQRFEFEVEQVATAGVIVPPRLSLACYGADAAVAPGERWAFTVRLRRPHGAFNPGGFDLEGWLFERDLRAGGYVREKPAPRRLEAMVWSRTRRSTARGPNCARGCNGDAGVVRHLLAAAGQPVEQRRLAAVRHAHEGKAQRLEPCGHTGVRDPRR